MCIFLLDICYDNCILHKQCKRKLQQQNNDLNASKHSFISDVTMKHASFVKKVFDFKMLTLDYITSIKNDISLLGFYI